MNPKVWIASGHVGGFNDPMVDDKETKQRFRADHLFGVFVASATEGSVDAAYQELIKRISTDADFLPMLTCVAASEGEAQQEFAHTLKKLVKPLGMSIEVEPKLGSDNRLDLVMRDRQGNHLIGEVKPVAPDKLKRFPDRMPSPFTQKSGVLTEPRQFNLMFKTFVGAIESEDSMAYLRPETAQGIFANFRNVVDTSRVKVPFGIAQIGKAFRNEVTPRNFTFRSREFEQMEIEFFIRPDSAKQWYQFWRDARFKWWQSVGITSTHLQLREHDKDELSHYAKEGAGTSDIEYRFPFTDPGFGELEGVAHRTDFDLRAHAEHSGLKDKLKYFDQELQVKLQGQGLPKEEIAAKSKYFPHVIEPSAGADRGTLAVLCEAFTPDPARPSGVVMKFHPRLAPIKAAIYPLVAKDGMPEVAEKLYLELRQKYAVETDAKQSIGKRYARMDEAGTPYCFTIDGETLTTQTVTVRHRDSLQQERIGLDKVSGFLAEKIGG
jgi:glycyl-tRNA synthetase